MTREQDIRRRDVPVDDAVAVREVQALEHLHGDVQTRVQWNERIPFTGHAQQGRQIDAVDELHDDVQRVAKAAEVLLTASDIAGQAYACYDRYVSQHEIASIAQKLSGASGEPVERMA